MGIEGMRFIKLVAKADLNSTTLYVEDKSDVALNDIILLPGGRQFRIVDTCFDASLGVKLEDQPGRGAKLLRNVRKILMLRDKPFEPGIYLEIQ